MDSIWDLANPHLRDLALYEPGKPIEETARECGLRPEEIVKLTTVLITYKECPHLDAKDRGVQAARIMADVARGKVKPVQALAKPPLIVNIAGPELLLDPIIQFEKKFVGITHLL
jgi:hypothetical protein